MLALRVAIGLREAFYRLRQDSRAQDLAEYGIALAAIGAGAAVTALAIRGDVAELWATGARLLRTATGQGGNG